MPAPGHRLHFAEAEHAERGRAEERPGEPGLPGDVADRGDPKSQALLDADPDRTTNAPGVAVGRGVLDDLDEPVCEMAVPSLAMTRRVAQLQVRVCVDETWQDDDIAEVVVLGVAVRLRELHGVAE